LVFKSDNSISSIYSKLFGIIEALSSTDAQSLNDQLWKKGYYSREFTFREIGNDIKKTKDAIKIGIQNPFNCGGQPDCTIMTLIVAILEKIVMPIAAVGVVMWIVYAGFTFVTAQGVPKKIEEAK